MTKQATKRAGVFGMVGNDGYFRWRPTYPMEKAAPTGALAKGEIREYKLYLIGGKSRKHTFCFIYRSA